MFERIAVGELPSKPHTRGDRGRELRYELCLTRDGFEGPYTMLYHVRRPHAHRRVAPPAPAFHPGAHDAGIARWHLPSQPTPGRTALLFNQDVSIARRCPVASDDVYVQYADADTLLYVQSGRGTLISGFGRLTFGPHDYVFVPKGVLHRIELDEGPQHWLECQFAAGFSIPGQYRNGVGQLRMDAPYSHRDIRRPQFEGPVDEAIRTVVVVKQGIHSPLEYEHSPIDVVGYDGTVYPFAFSIHDFQPKVGAIHLPPTIHATFCARGALVCSFVPRPLDFREDAIPCPYPHASVDVDEVIFYSEGEFTSRRGVGQGSLSLHPRGIPHGPHPGRYEASIGARQTQELAVMLDCALPLQLTSAALATADPDYDASFFETR